MLDRLPIELQMSLLEVEPRLRFVSRSMYALHNDLVKDRLLRSFSSEQLELLTPYLREYLLSLNFWNGALVSLLAPEPHWPTLWAFLKNRKVFFNDPDEFTIQSGDVRFLPDRVHITRANTVHYARTVELIPGCHELQLLFKNHERTRGLGTARFALCPPDHSQAVSDYPPTNINEMVPTDGNVIALQTCEKFVVKGCKERGLIPCKLHIDELGMYLKEEWELIGINFRAQRDPAMFIYSTGYKEIEPLDTNLHMAIDQILKTGDCTHVPLISKETTGWDYEEYYTHSKASNIKYRTPNDKPNDTAQVSSPGSGGLVSWTVPF